MRSRPLTRAFARAVPFLAIATVLSCGSASEPGAPNPAFLNIVSGDVQSGAVGTALPEPLVVRVVTADTIPARGLTVDFSVRSGGAELSARSVVTSADGTARVTLVPTAAGNIQVVANVASSSLAVVFLASASGPAASPCLPTAPPLHAIGGEIIPGLGGTGICVAADSVGGDYALVAFNSSGTASATLTVSASNVQRVASPDPALARAASSVDWSMARTSLAATGPARSAVVDIQRTARAQLRPLFGAARAWLAARPANPPAVAPAVGTVLPVNTNIVDACANADVSGARVVAVTTGSVVLADTTNPPGGFADGDYRAIATLFDTLVVPAETLSMKGPSDIDANGRVVLVFTWRVNSLGAAGAGGPDAIDAVFQPRDLFPVTGAAQQPVCGGSNAAEMLYLAVPDPQGTRGPARTSQQVRDDFPRTAAHELEHLINASRHLYGGKAAGFEETWLDEGLGRAAEEILFERESGYVSRTNLGSLELEFSAKTVNAFRTTQAPNFELYRRYLAALPARSAIADDSTGDRGATWSLLRYLSDHRDTPDWDTWTRLLDATTTGVANLETVFGTDFRFRMRDWMTSLLVDDIFATDVVFQQPSWNFRSIFPAVGVAPYPLAFTPLTAATPVTLTLPPGGGVFFRFAAAPGQQGTVTWTNGSAAISPALQWTLVRTR